MSSDEDISVTFYASGEVSLTRTAGSMRLIPEDALGREHYLVTISTGYSYFQVFELCVSVCVCVCTGTHILRCGFV